MRFLPRTRDRRILVATAVLAVGVPAGAAAWIRAQTDALAAHLSAAGEIPVRIGGVDADLTGAIRLSEVAFGELFAAEAIEASVALESLLAGELRADEVRVAAPRVALQIGADGDSDLAKLARRLARRGSGRRGPAARLRRIVVSSGTLTAEVAGLGTIAADGVELVPDRGGMRLITGAVRAHGAQGPVAIDVAFSRSAAEIALPQVELRRGIAVGGTGTITAESTPIVLRDIVAGRLTPGGILEVRASVDDSGIARSLAIELAPNEHGLTVRGDDLPLAALASVVPRGLVLDGAHAGGELSVHRHGRRLELALDASVEGAALDDRTLASEPIPLSGAIHARIALSPEALTVRELALASGAIKLEGTGWLRRGEPASGQVELALAAAPCGDLLAALPAPVLGPLDGMTLAGTLAGRARLTIDLAAPPGDGIVLWTELTGGCRALAEPPAADVTSLLVARDHTFIDGTRGRVGPGAPGWVEYRDVPAQVRGAFVSAEDGRFWDHAGFDLAQIARSLEVDLRERRLARGGSTISQQLIKNVFLTHRRTLDRKLQEAILTWRLEDRLDKKQILTRYLNLIELGPRVFGVGAAARHWFDTTPRELTPRQAAFLAALTSEPTSMGRRVRRHGGLDPVSTERVATVLRAMRRDGVIGADAFDAAKTAPMSFAATALGGEP